MSDSRFPVRDVLDEMFGWEIGAAAAAAVVLTTLVMLPYGGLFALTPDMLWINAWLGAIVPQVGLAALIMPVLALGDPSRIDLDVNRSACFKALGLGIVISACGALAVIVGYGRMFWLFEELQAGRTLDVGHGGWTLLTVHLAALWGASYGLLLARRCRQHANLIRRARD